MNSTSTPKSIEPPDGLAACADERLERAHEQIRRAGEELDRLSEQVKKMERDATRPFAARRGLKAPRERPAPRPLVVLPVGWVIGCCCLFFASALWRGTQTVCRVFSPPALSNSILPAENPAAPRTVLSSYCSNGHGRGTTASNARD